MKISKKTLEEYKRIYEKEYGHTISDKEAYEGASNLLLFMKTLVDIKYRNRLVDKKS